MALDFPDSPAVGDLYGSTDTVWRWDGEIWSSTAGASGPRGVVLRIPTLADGPIIPITPAVATPITNVVTFTFKAGRTYRVVLHLRAIEATSMTVTGQLLLAGVAYSDFYERVDAPYQGMHAEFLLSYPVDTTQTVQWCMNSAGMANIHGGGNHSYIEDVTYEAGSGGPSIVPTPWTAPVMTNGWTSYGPTPVMYRKVGDIVYLRGYIVAPNPINSLPWTTVPDGFKAGANGEYITSGYAGGRAKCTLTTDTGGTCTVHDGMTAGGTVALAQISWSITP